ncbi:MAG: MFS transporter [Alphaproteobacteria bacterium]|nr:MFS transporter [Alphaproteobacteria bacterium]
MTEIAQAARPTTSLAETSGIKTSAIKASAINSWRTPVVIIVCGCLISLLGFGPRSSFGFFLTPMSQANGWGRDVFALAFALQNLLWGLGQPFAGAVADRFGMVRVLSVGALLYAAGLALMAYTTSPVAMQITAGGLIGFGLSGCSFNLVIAAFGKLLSERYRMLAIGAGTAAGSFGQFLFAPFGVALIDNVGWQHALLVFGGLLLLIVPLSLALATQPNAPSAPAPGKAQSQSLTSALSEAFGHRSYVLLVFGFFTCGFQLAFITLHLPSYLVDRGLSAQVGGWTLATIGLFNIIGSISVSWLTNYFPRRYLLATNYFLRAVFIAAFVLLPASTVTTLLFGAGMGLLWLSTVPPTSSLVSLMFGTRWLATLYGFAFFSHQVGGFLGAWMGGLLYERTGSYDIVWWLAVAFGILSAVINLPIEEKPVLRATPAAA